MIPEMSSPKICTGSICVDQKEKKKFTVLGYCKNQHVRTELHPSADGTDRVMVKGFLIESDKIQFVQKNLLQLKPQFSEDEVAQAKSSIIMHDPGLVRKLLDAFDHSEKPFYRTIVLRGFSNMIRLLKSEYISFLESNDLLSTVVDKFKPVSS